MSVVTTRNDSSAGLTENWLRCLAKKTLKAQQVATKDENQCKDIFKVCADPFLPDRLAI